MYILKLLSKTQNVKSEFELLFRRTKEQLWASGAPPVSCGGPDGAYVCDDGGQR
jgi:hypothetical protein